MIKIEVSEPDTCGYVTLTFPNGKGGFYVPKEVAPAYEKLMAEGKFQQANSKCTIKTCQKCPSWGTDDLLIMCRLGSYQGIGTIYNILTHGWPAIPSWCPDPNLHMVKLTNSMGA